jgi:hypothetical protein
LILPPVPLLVFLNLPVIILPFCDISISPQYSPWQQLNFQLPSIEVFVVLELFIDCAASRIVLNLAPTTPGNPSNVPSKI